jgi:hypothetical protein
MSNVTSVVAMHRFRKRLYVGSSGWYNEQIPASELIRIGRNGRWQVVVGAPRTVGGRLKLPISGLSDGFDNVFAAHFWRIADDGEALYVGTNDWSWTLQVGTQVPLIQSLLAPEFGFDVWASCRGKYWFPITRDAFGGNSYDFGARNLLSSRSGLYIGSANHAQGTTVWRSRVGACSSLVGRRGRRSAAAGAAAQSAATPPQRVLTDRTRGGTVVSWEPSPQAARYRVLRTDYRTVQLSVVPAPVLPNGFRLEDQVPIVTEPGHPGSTVVNVPTPSRSMRVGTTTARFFVDRGRVPGSQAAYQVVAETASGAQSSPSSLQVVPSHRSRATFERVRREIGSGALADVAADAHSAWRRGDRGGALRRLVHLRRAVGGDEELRELVYRLERRVRYRTVLGRSCRRQPCR